MSGQPVETYLVVPQGLLFSSKNPIVAGLKFILRRNVADSLAMERLVRDSATQRVIVRPPRPLDGGKARGYRAQTGALPNQLGKCGESISPIFSSKRRRKGNISAKSSA
jgi:hypothetical protein